MLNPKTKTRFQIHVVLFKIVVDDQENMVDSDVLEEEELAGHLDDFEDESAARGVFSVATGVDVTGDDMTKTYVVAHDEYMGIEQGMYQFRGTYRQLLEMLTDLNDENRNEVVPIDPIHGVEGLKKGEKPFGEFTDRELVNLFNSGNGDGQPYVMVWCVEEQKQVLG